MNVDALDAGTTDSVRAAIAALLRVGEPGDGLLKRMVEEIGPIATHSVITAVADGEATAVEAVTGLASSGAEAAGHGQLADAIDLVVQMRVETVPGQDGDGPSRRYRWVSEVLHIAPGEGRSGYA